MKQPYVAPLDVHRDIQTLGQRLGDKLQALQQNLRGTWAEDEEDFGVVIESITPHLVTSSNLL